MFGVVELQEDDLTKSFVNLKIQAQTIDTGFPPRDHDLGAPDFLEVTKFPEIIFASQSGRKAGGELPSWNLDHARVRQGSENPGT